MSKRIICENSLRWILNYRYALKSKNPTFNLKKMADRDGHSGGSWHWTKLQSQKIDEMGWDNWFNKTQGPEGYGPYFGKFLESWFK